VRWDREPIDTFVGEHAGARAVHFLMRAISVTPGKTGAVALEDIAEPAGHGEVLARTLAIGICGTRRVPLSRWSEAFERLPDDVKVVIDFLA
jgi:hypothetical protein